MPPRPLAAVNSAVGVPDMLLLRRMSHGVLPLAPSLPGHASGQQRPQRGPVMPPRRAPPPAPPCASLGSVMPAQHSPNADTVTPPLPPPAAPGRPTEVVARLRWKTSNCCSRHRQGLPHLCRTAAPPGSCTCSASPSPPKSLSLRSPRSLMYAYQMFDGLPPPILRCRMQFHRLRIPSAVV
ncbi:hypothetical protein ACP70R_048870 [Stipagrostis hirtigluma subsp. patula]